MKKILFLLLLLAPLFANAQYWYKADAMRFKFGNNLEEWEKCNLRVYIDKSNNIKIFSLNNSINIRSVNDDYTLKEDERGNSRLSWVCVDEEGASTAPLFQQEYEKARFEMVRDWIDFVPLEYIQDNTGAITDPYYRFRFTDDSEAFGIF